MKTKQLVYIMVFGVVTSDGDAMPPFTFRPSFRLNIKDSHHVPELGITGLDQEGGF